MKVAIVHSYYSSRQPSGENIVVDAQVKALREHGVDVRLIAARTDELETRPHYNMRTAINVASGGGASPLRELREFAPDIVHVHNLFPNWGTAWLDQWDGPIVATLHNYRPVCAAGTLFRDGKVCTLCPDSNTFEAVKNACYRGSKVATLPLALRTRNGVGGDRLLSRADRVILLTGRARGLFERFGLSATKISVIPNFVDDVGFLPLQERGDDWVYIGRLSDEKGIANLVKHWPESQGLSIYGDGPVRGYVQAEAATRPNVTYHGSIDRSAVPGVLAKAGGLVFPSEWPEGGVPLSYVEALAAGRMVVAKVGSSGADDLVEAGAGVVFSGWDDLEEALVAASANADAFSSCARRHFENNYIRSIFLARTMAMYELLSKNGRRS